MVDAGDHRLSLHVMKRIVVVEASEVLFKRPRSAIERFDD